VYDSLGIGVDVLVGYVMLCIGGYVMLCIGGYVMYWWICYVMYWWVCYVVYWWVCYVMYWWVCYVTLILSSHLLLRRFPAGFPTKILCDLIVDEMHATWPAHLTLIWSPHWHLASSEDNGAARCAVFCNLILLLPWVNVVNVTLTMYSYLVENTVPPHYADGSLNVV
jgi:hypothetical protein